MGEQTDTPESPNDGTDETPAIDPATGEVRGTVVGLESFRSGWEHDVDLPHKLAFSAWQLADDDHPAEGGRPGYRLVHKTIRTITFPETLMVWANLRLFAGNGKVTAGEPEFAGTIRRRREGEFLVPEWGDIGPRDDGQFGYRYRINPNIDIKPKNVEHPECNHVEVLCLLPEGTGSGYAEQLAAGRAVVAPLTATLDLLFGERLLGPVLAEEVGEVFGDWHWNRKLGGRNVALESQAKMQALGQHEFATTVGTTLKRYFALADEQRQRIRVASQWYWRAEAETDEVLSFVGYWLVIEGLELGENADINPVKESVAQILGTTRPKVAEHIGRLYGTRSKLVHGKRHLVSAEELTRVRAIANALLEKHALGTVSAQRTEELRQRMAIASSPDASSPK